MLLSIIVPIYNVEPYLERCIDSILSQTYEHLEIILVDDGSTDLSSAICDEYADRDSRITVIHKENGGLISARYAGVCASHAEYVTFVDGDDWIAPSMYDSLMQPVLKYGTDMVVSGIIRYWSETNQVKHCNHLLQTGLYTREEIEAKIIPIMLWCERIDTWALDPSTCTKIFNRALLLEQIEPLKSYDFYYGEDTAITYPFILQAKSIYCMEQAYYYHRQKKARNIVSDYIMEENYFAKLYELYAYMVSRIQSHKQKDIILKQLDYFYMKSVNYHKGSCQNSERGKYYLFPFDKVPKNSRIILYGAGNVGQDYYNQVKRLNYCQIVLWVDKAYERFREEFGEEIKSIEYIQDADYEYIVVANVVSKSIIEIVNYLKSIGVNENKIVRLEIE